MSATNHPPGARGELDVDGVRQAIEAALAPVPVGERLAPAVVATTAQRLAEYARALLPRAAAAHCTRRSSRGPGLAGLGLTHVRYRLTHVDCPDAGTDVDAAHVWCQEMARSCQMLLGLVSDNNRGPALLPLPQEGEVPARPPRQSTTDIPYTKETIVMGRKDDQQQEPDDDDRAWNPDDDFGRPSDPTDPSTADGDAPHRR
ncbi:hypothetical protein [Streptomyces syringium]|uniref:hypothetical protein n=1 Tax=Streptomyces syringium TaxID=76729 RepID=UPI0033C15B78